MLRFAAVCVIVLLSTAVPLASQPAACSPDAYLDLIYAHSAAIDDPGANLGEAVDMLIAGLLTQRSVCENWLFSGSGNRIVGPLDLPAGMYIMGTYFQGQGFASVQSPTAGCAAAVALALPMALTPQGGEDYAILSLPTDCRLLVDMTTSSPWQLIFTPTS